MWKFFKTALASLAFLVVALVGWVVGSAYFAGRSDPGEVAYLKQHAAALDLKAADGGFRFPANVYQITVVPIG